jgi:hypothetical protein
VLRILVEKRIDLDLRALVARLRVAPVQNVAATGEVWSYMVDACARIFSIAGAPTAARDHHRNVRRGARGSPVSPLDFGAKLAALAKFLRIPGGKSHRSQQAHREHSQEG